MTKPTSNVTNRNAKNFSLRFFCFVLLLLTTIGITISIILSIKVKDVVEHTAENGLAISLGKNESAIHHFIDTHTSVLEDIAETAILIQATMQPDNHTGAASDFLDSVKILREKYRLTLLSFDQSFLFPKETADYAHYTQNETIGRAISEGTAQCFLHQRTDTVHWTIVVPILYIGHCEGALICEIPIEHMRSYLYSDSDFTDEQLDISFNGQSILSAGQTSASVFKKTKTIDAYGITISSLMNENKITASINQVLKYFWLIFAIIIVHCLFLAYKLGNYYLIKPLELARQHADALRIELEKTVRELEVSNDELVQFSYRTSHDLKAPLTASKRLSTFIVKDIEDGELVEAKTNVQHIHKQMEKLELLVTDILSLSKADAHADGRENVAFPSLLKDIKERLSWMIKESGCEIVDVVSVDHEIHLEKTRLAQIIENLLSNAIKYRNTNLEHNFVRVHIQDNGNKLSISISDNGIGIPTSKQADVFKMFHRFHPDISTGSGLGLSIVKKTCRKNEWRHYIQELRPRHHL